jgi:hypothetical protein
MDAPPSSHKPHYRRLATRIHHNKPENNSRFTERSNNMSWTGQVGALLKQYVSGGAATAPAPDVHAHFDQVAEAAPSGAIAEGLAAAFRSNQTPAFGQMLSTLFTNSSGDQKAGMLNQLLSSVSPGMLSQLTSGAGVAGLASLLSGGGSKLTPEQAQQISPEAIEQLAAHAEKANPSVIDSISTFYAEHSSLVKSLGGAALTVALAKIAERRT